MIRSTRHVLATTFTTIAGFLPLILAGGGFWPPLAITIAGGVVGATLLALVFVPSAYVIVNRVRKTVSEAGQHRIPETKKEPAHDELQHDVRTPAAVDRVGQAS